MRCNLPLGATRYVQRDYGFGYLRGQEWTEGGEKPPSNKKTLLK